MLIRSIGTLREKRRYEFQALQLTANVAHLGTTIFLEPQPAMPAAMAAMARMYTAFSQQRARHMLFQSGQFARHAVDNMPPKTCESSVFGNRDQLQEESPNLW